MSPRTAAAAVARGGATLHPPARTRPVPGPARRRSGAAVRPRTKTRQPAGAARGVALPRHDFVGILDRLLRGPVYIALVGVLLAGIVFFNVGVLQLNHGIARTDVHATQLERENATLTRQLAMLASSERIQRLAIERGLLLPQPGDVRYLRANPDDAGRALRVMSAPATAVAAPTLVTQSSQPATATQPATTAQPTTAATVATP